MLGILLKFMASSVACKNDASFMGGTNSMANQTLNGWLPYVDPKKTRI
ncbi:hypothetical protein G159_20010 [Planococcus glaciei CHR43]|nr:hypothetical protein G159_20010 [Planococcus glaciei CHR43]